MDSTLAGAGRGHSLGRVYEYLVLLPVAHTMPQCPVPHPAPHRHWASQGPQVTLYVPGPLLHAGDNEIVLLELEDTAERDHAAVSFVDEPDFYGPASQGMAGAGVSIAGAPGRRTAHGPV